MRDESQTAWDRFCDSANAHRAELRKIQRENEKVREAIRAYYNQHRVTVCAPGTEFTVRADRTLEVK